MQKSNVDFYPVLLLSILADTLLRLHTGYWARAGLLALPASAAVLAAVLLLVSTSWQENALLQKVLCVLLAISSALEILRLHALFGSVYPGTLGLAGTCFVVLAPVIYLRREPALRQTANALLVFGAACMAIMVLSVAPRLHVPNLHAAPLTGQDWQAAFVSQLALPPEYLLFAFWPPQPGQRCRKAVTFAASALGFDAAVHLLLELFFGGRGFITGHVSPAHLKLNLPEDWTDPATGEERHGGAFALLKDAQHRCELFMTAALGHWMGKLDEEILEKTLGSMSYITGTETEQSKSQQVPDAEQAGETA